MWQIRVYFKREPGKCWKSKPGPNAEREMFQMFGDLCDNNPDLMILR